MGSLETIFANIDFGLFLKEFFSELFTGADVKDALSAAGSAVGSDALSSGSSSNGS